MELIDELEKEIYDDIIIYNLFLGISSDTANKDNYLTIYNNLSDDDKLLVNIRILQQVISNLSDEDKAILTNSIMIDSINDSIELNNSTELMENIYTFDQDSMYVLQDIITNIEFLEGISDNDYLDSINNILNVSTFDESIQPSLSIYNDFLTNIYNILSSEDIKSLLLNKNLSELLAYFDIYTKTDIYDLVKNILDKKLFYDLDYLKLDDVVNFINSLDIHQIESLFSYSTNKGNFTDLDIIIQNYIASLNINELNDFRVLMDRLFYVYINEDSDPSNAISIENIIGETPDTPLEFSDLSEEQIIEYLYAVGNDLDFYKLFNQKGINFIKDYLLMLPDHSKAVLYNKVKDFLHAEGFSLAVNDISPQYGFRFIGNKPILNYEYKSNIQLTDLKVKLIDITDVHNQIELVNDTYNLEFNNRDAYNDKAKYYIDNINEINKIYKIEAILMMGDTVVYTYDTTYDTVESILPSFSLQNKSKLFLDIHDKINQKVLHKFNPEFMMTESVNRINVNITKYNDSTNSNNIISIDYERGHKEFDLRIHADLFKPRFNVIYDITDFNTENTSNNLIYPTTRVVITAYDVNNTFIRKYDNLYKESIKDYLPQIYDNNYTDLSKYAYNKQKLILTPPVAEPYDSFKPKADNISSLWSSDVSNINSIFIKNMVSRDNSATNIYNIMFDLNLSILPKCTDSIIIYRHTTSDFDVNELIDENIIYTLPLNNLITKDFGNNNIDTSISIPVDLDNLPSEIVGDEELHLFHFGVYLTKDDVKYQNTNISHDFESVLSYEIITPDNVMEDLNVLELYNESKYSDFVGIIKYGINLEQSGNVSRAKIMFTTKMKGDINTYKTIVGLYTNSKRTYGNKVYEKITNEVSVTNVFFETQTSFILNNTKRYYGKIETFHPHDSGKVADTVLFEIDPLEYRLGNDLNVFNDLDGTKGMVTTYENLTDIYEKNINILNKVDNTDYIVEEVYNLTQEESIDNNMVSTNKTILYTSDYFDTDRLFNIGASDSNDEPIDIDALNYNNSTPANEKNIYNLVYSNEVDNSFVIEDTVNLINTPFESITNKNSIQISMETSTQNLYKFDNLVIFNHTPYEVALTLNFVVSNYINTVNNQDEHGETQGNCVLVIGSGINQIPMDQIPEFVSLSLFSFDSYCFNITNAEFTNQSISEVALINIDKTKYNNYIYKGKSRVDECGPVFYQNPNIYAPNDLISITANPIPDGTLFHNFSLLNNSGEILIINASFAISSDDSIGIELTDYLEIELNELNQNVIKVSDISNSFRNYANSIAVKIISIIGQYSGIDYLPLYLTNQPSGVTTFKLTDMSISLDENNFNV